MIHLFSPVFTLLVRLHKAVVEPIFNAVTCVFSPTSLFLAYHTVLSRAYRAFVVPYPYPYLFAQSSVTSHSLDLAPRHKEQTWLDKTCHLFYYFFFLCILYFVDTVPHATGNLTDIVELHGGDILKFAGDAILVCWTPAAELDVKVSHPLSHQDLYDTSSTPPCIYGSHTGETTPPTV